MTMNRYIAGFIASIALVTSIAVVGCKKDEPPQPPKNPNMIFIESLKDKEKISMFKEANNDFEQLHNLVKKNIEQGNLVKARKQLDLLFEGSQDKKFRDGLLDSLNRLNEVEKQKGGKSQTSSIKPGATGSIWIPLSGHIYNGVTIYQVDNEGNAERIGKVVAIDNVNRKVSIKREVSKTVQVFDRNNLINRKSALFIRADDEVYAKYR